MLLRELLGDLDVPELLGDSGIEIASITHDSRQVRPGSLFCCVPGAHYDGHEFAVSAVAAGAGAVVVERIVDGLTVPQIRVTSVRESMGPMAAAFYGHPSRAISVLGVTGTNGKTTTTYLLESMAAAAGMRSGVIGTVEVRLSGEAPVRDLVPGNLTTPEATDLQRVLAGMRDQGVKVVAMEVSSHALRMHRVDGIWFTAACFTNLSHEHLDFHRDIDEYFAAKLALFDPTRTAAAACNLDDPHGAEVSRLVAASGMTVVPFGIHASGAAVRADNLVVTPTGNRFTLWLPDLAQSIKVRSPLIGRFNVANVLAAAATAVAAGFDSDAIVAGIESPMVIPGRFERVALTAVPGGTETGTGDTEFGDLAVFVDYAHTPDALRHSLQAARELAANSRGRVLVVFGCGGDRDREKRPVMGEVASELADLVFVTSDNPRTEDAAAIVAEILPGLRGAEARMTVELDRRMAIHAAVTAAGTGDVVIVAGKGHEQGQTSGGVTVPFDDRVVAREALERRLCA